MGCDCFGDDVGRRERERFEFGSRLGWSLSLALPPQVRLYERWTRDYERWTRDHERLLCWAGCLKQDLRDFFGIFGMAEALLAWERLYK